MGESLLQSTVGGSLNEVAPTTQPPATSETPPTNSNPETLPPASVAASDAWFAANAVPNNSREVQGQATIIANLVTPIFKVLGFNPDAAWGLVVGQSGWGVFDGIRRVIEARQIRATTRAEATDAIKAQKTWAAISTVAQGAALLLMTSSLAVTLPVTALIGIVRYGIVNTLENQIDTVGNPESNARTESENWFKKNLSLNNLPTWARKFEEYSNYISAVAYGATGAFALFSNPFLAILLGAGAGYHYWAGRYAVRPVAKYYDKLSDEASARRANTPATAS